MKALDITAHKINLTNILIDIYKNTLLSSILGFKGGTAAMLFYNLPRFSVDLDFDLTNKLEKDSEEFNKFIETMTKLLSSKYMVKDQSSKYNTLFWLVSYGVNLAHIKVEVSTRENPYNHYISMPFYGASINTLVAQDMIAHKMIALMERTSIANRDLFDVHYFLSSQYAVDINYDVIRFRTQKEPRKFYIDLLEFVSNINPKNVLAGLGEVLTESQKDWAKSKLIEETKGLIQRQIDLLS